MVVDFQQAVDLVIDHFVAKGHQKSVSYLVLNLQKEVDKKLKIRG
ncbi:hypothetical protein HSIEG1_437 [Enterococcus sp. HSIEG1]|nr:hypothetical protein HSIEG1_437 [Enterococcus sp. HSIEG1]